MTAVAQIQETWKIFVDQLVESCFDDLVSFDAVVAAVVDAGAVNVADVECSDDQKHDVAEADLATFPVDAVHEDDLSETQDDLHDLHLTVHHHLLQSETT